MKNNWHGFLPNCWDTKIMSSYVDENFSNGLKQNSKRYLEYEQVDYKTVTSKTGILGELPKGGRIIRTDTDPDGGPDIVTKQYRMNELTAKDVVAYGADDTICTAALYNFYLIQLELENTDQIVEEVEVKPAYLTALGFLTGCKVSLERLNEIEEEDDETFEKARSILAHTLLDEGLLDQMWEPYTECRCADFKQAFETLYGYKIESKVRTHEKLAIQMESDPNIRDVPGFSNFVDAVRRQDIGYVNELLLDKFKRDPVIDMGSSKQMQKFLYDILGLPVRKVNSPTPLEKKENKPLADALFKFLKAAMKGEEAELTEQEYAFVKGKASTDDDAVGMALALDCEARPIAKTVLTSMQQMKIVMTRRSLYYSKYKYQAHYSDGLIHAAINQCAAVTRRYSSSGPNLQQLPKKGEGIKIREAIIPHHRDAVVVSLDFKGQELILCADQSGDENMIACYVGDNKKDLHSLTAAGAMELVWGKKKLDELIAQINWDRGYRTGEDKYALFTALHKEVDDAVIHKLADDLRKKSKNTNFAAQYDSQALTLSYTLLMPAQVAQQFIDAKHTMFPKVETWKDSVRQRVASTGYARTLMGARRHLAKLMFDGATANKAARQGPNFEIQGSSAEQTKLAMARVWDSGVCYDYDCRFIAPVHDEVVFSIHRDHVVDCIRIIHQCMTAPYSTMKIQPVASISLGPNFGIQFEAGDDFNEANIVKMLGKIFDKEKVAA